MKALSDVIKGRGWLRFVTYAAVGAVGTLVQYAILIACVALHLTGPVVGSTVGAVAGAIVNYFLNVRYTFRARSHAACMTKFAITALLAAALNALLMKILIDVFSVHYVLAQLVSTGVILCLTYGINLVWTFSHTSDQQPTE